MPDKNGDLSIEGICVKYGVQIPKPWDWRRKPTQEPRVDCFGYLPALGSHEDKCTALTRLYCKYEECHFYKTYEELKEMAHGRKID